MEREAFFSGYCRQIDGSRMIAVVAEGKELLEADCCYPECPYEKDCPIGKKIAEFLNEN
ncbi:MAG: hypothetical protein J6Q54_06300 [Oscillospiraceae bacterium]|nr:hypothetical protein [Oscillospiraceae bacterium]